MQNFDDVAAIVASLPHTEESLRRGNRTWYVGGKAFAWERPFTKADLRRFGTDPVPAGPLLGVRTASLVAKEAYLASGEPAIFTIAHFDTFSAILIRLDEVGPALLREVIDEAWHAMAPPKLR